MKSNPKIALRRVANRKRKPVACCIMNFTEPQVLDSTLPGFKWNIMPSTINPSGFDWREVAISSTSSEVSITPANSR